MPRRTGEETRSLLISTGMEMLLDRGISAGVAHIRLQEVVRRAGLTTGAAYRLWADQDDFHRDLAVAMARWRHDRPAESSVLAVEELLRSGKPLDEVIRLAAVRHVQSFDGDGGTGGSRTSRLFLIALALRATAQTWDDLKVASNERHEESVEEFVTFYRMLMSAYGFRMRTPYTIRDFAVAMAALGEGFALHAIEGLDHPMLTIDVDDEGPPGEWTLFGICVRGLVHQFMVADGSAADEGPREQPEETPPALPSDGSSGAAPVGRTVRRRRS